VLDMK